MINAKAIREKAIANAMAEAEDTIKHETMKETVLEGLKDKGAFVAPAGYMHSYGGQMHVETEVETLPEAIELVERLNPLSMFLKKEGGTSFLPEGHKALTERAGNNPAWQAANPMKEPELVQPYIYVIDGLRQYAETKTVKCFIQVESYVVEVSIRVKKDDLTRRSWRLIKRDGETLVEGTSLKNDSGYFSRSLRFWSTPEHPNRFVCYTGV